MRRGGDVRGSEVVLDVTWESEVRSEVRLGEVKRSCKVSRGEMSAGGEGK